MRGLLDCVIYLGRPKRERDEFLYLLSEDMSFPNQEGATNESHSVWVLNSTSVVISPFNSP